MNGAKPPTTETATGSMWSITVTTTHPQLHRCQNPNGNLNAEPTGSVNISASEIMRGAVRD